MDEIEVKAVPSCAPKMRVIADKDREVARAKAHQYYADHGLQLPAACYVVVRSWTNEYWLPMPEAK